METAIEMRQAALDRHLRSIWSKNVHTDARWESGPIELTIPGLRVRCVEPSEPSEPWIYVSLGASAAGEGFHEFALLSPFSFPRHVETVTMVADWQAAGRNADVGALLRIGWPWIQGSESDQLLVSDFYAYPPEFGTFQDGGKEISILWLVPVHANEAAYVRRRSQEALEDRFERNDVNLLDPRRGSVLGMSEIS
ncbi:suppressor of fused domain protein [Streptomyces sp. NPDC091215]|uniref:suppressor of fused domain protein n=1 Tax=Streptomyces sp. NPDC091215 TaxID=3155192 RepID=UPI00341BA398